MIHIIHKIKYRLLNVSVLTMLMVLLFPIFPSMALANSDYQPSPWALSKIQIAKTAKLLPEDFGGQDYTTAITRRDFCQLLINGCRLFQYQLPDVSQFHPFTDTQDIAARQAFMLGLTSGTAEGIFSPHLPLTREMAVAMLGKVRLLLQADGKLMDEQPAEEILKKYIKDSDNLSPWAKISMADAYSRGIITGTDYGILSPKNHVTREQAVILTLNTLLYCDQSPIKAAGVKECLLPAPSGIYLSPTYQRGEVNLAWGEVPAASGYEVKIYKNDILAYSTQTKNNNLDFRTSSQPNNSSLPENIFGDERDEIKAILEVTPLDQSGKPSIFSLKREFTVLPKAGQRVRTIASRSQTSFRSQAEALSYMEDITVPVWQLSSGIKVPATITFTVHKDVAEDVKKIFEEIFNGKEKFPIKSCIGYSYRGSSSSSQHNFGLAIDINPDENYFIGRDGVIKAGKLWKPGENPYSILPDGDVVKAFKKYGWHWSPEMHWSNGADYMHFSLSGT
ncbi:MAG: hypothetical protein GXW85_05335 [Clostridia bacterium]|nr:hypothetical protein [Clostridia bacterium]